MVSESYKKRLKSLNLPLFVKVDKSIHNAYNFDMMDMDFDYSLGLGVYIVEEEMSNTWNIEKTVKLKGIEGEFQSWMFEELSNSEIKAFWREKRLRDLLE